VTVAITPPPPIRGPTMRARRMCARRRFQVTADRKLLAGGEEILRYESPPKSGGQQTAYD
jgi:hypothetical protein